MDKYELTFRYDKTMETLKWQEQIPYLHFKKDWVVKIVPPFGGAVCRFRVKNRIDQKESVSIYLDCYNNLGIMDEPYWEVYPIDDDARRFYMYETDELMECIEQALKQLGK